MNIKETYDEIAEEWHKDHQGDDWWVEGTDKFISLLKSGASVLDVGCGGGTKSRYLVKNGLKITGIDISDNMVKIAQREVPEGKFEVMDLKNISNLENNFDGIFAQAVLLHIPKKEIRDTIYSLTKKINSGGYLYIALKEKKMGGPEEEVVKEDTYGYKYERFFSYFTIDEIEQLLLDAELTIVYKKVQLIGKTGWINIIGRK